MTLTQCCKDQLCTSHHVHMCTDVQYTRLETIIVYAHQSVLQGGCNQFNYTGLSRVSVGTHTHQYSGLIGLVNFCRREGPKQYHIVLFSHVQVGLFEALYSALLVSFCCLCTILITGKQLFISIAHSEFLFCEMLVY